MLFLMVLACNNDATESKHDSVEDVVTAEVCDGVDNDGDGAVDEEASDAVLWYVDTDGDGFGAGEGTLACIAPDGTADQVGDCDDINPDIYPGAPEVYYDGVDADCSGGSDDDADGDGVDVGTDCNDNDPNTYPGAPEIWYDGIDEDCMGGSDNDADSDGYDGGDAATDCDDNDPNAYPGAADVCGDGVDSDCDGQACGIVGGLSLSAADIRITGADPNAYIGYFMDAGDVDGDGGADIVVGTFARGAFLLGSPYSATQTTASARATFQSSGLTLGVAIADTAGDGQSEVIIGLDDGSGRVIARVPSSTQGVSDPLDVGTLWSGSSDNGLGEIIVSGDSDGDGAEDILVSEIYSNNGAGTVWLIQGDAGAGSVSQVASASISGHLSNENAGKSVALGDVNGDGSPDIVVGAIGYVGGNLASGAAYLVYGPVSGAVDLSQADAVFTGSMSSGRMGNDVVLADSDQDGHDEVYVSDPFYGPSLSSWYGAVYGFSGALSGSYGPGQAASAVLGTTFQSQAGWSFDAGDFDRDGHADLLIGALGALGNQGQVSAISGPLSGTRNFEDGAVLTGEVSGENAGNPVVVADLSGDGVDDGLIAAVYGQSGGQTVGVLYGVFAQGF